MNLERFLAERADEWAELQQLVSRSGVRGRALSPVQVRRLGALYRSAAADLAVARREFPEAVGTARIQTLVASAYGVVYGRSRRTETVRGFVGRSMWQAVRSTGWALWLAIGLTVGFTALGALWALVDPRAASGILPFVVNPHPGNHGLAGIPLAARPGLATEIFTNNIGVSFLALAGGFTLGLLTAYLIAFNSALLGVLGMLEWRAHQFSQFVRLIVPHGVLELSCIAIAGATGFHIAAALVHPGLRTRSQSLRSVFPVVGDAILAVCLALVVAGLTEGIVTTWNLPLWLALTYGLTLAGIFWGLVFWRGRPGPAPADPAAAPAPRPIAALALAGPLGT